MSDDEVLKPIGPHLAALAAAFDEPSPEPPADAEARAAEARARQEEQDLHDDRVSILRALRKGGGKAAHKVGRALGWNKHDIDEVIQSSSGDAPTSSDDRADGGPDGVPPKPDGSSSADEDMPFFRREKNPIKPLPDDCPVVVLGTSGGNFHYLTPLGEYLAIAKLDQNMLRTLFVSRLDYLWNLHPKFSEQTGKQTGWKADRTAETLIDACGRRGVFDPVARLRGVGAWIDDEDGLVLHAGNEVFYKGEWRKPGYLGEHVYPGADKLPRPADDSASHEGARRLLSLFGSWTWDAERDGDDDNGQIQLHELVRIQSILLLGWIGCALVGGALDWRPTLWITGDAGTGKSTLQKLISAVMGGSLVVSSDATSAGIYQSVGYSSRAVGIDEAENDPRSQKMKNMIDLVRQSASGGVILRGSNDAKFKAFTARSAFLLSSIIIPPLGTQDLTRITTLALGPLDTSAPVLKIDPVEMAAIGRGLRRRIMDAWERWPETLQRYRAALTATGHDNRGADQFGALLGMADMLMFDDAPEPDIVSVLAGQVSKDRMRERQEEPTNAESMLNWLISIPLDVFRGGTRMTIGTLVAGAANLQANDLELREQLEGVGATPASFVRALHAHGIYVEGVGMMASVTLPNQSAGLAQLFADTAWGTSPGAATSGWQQALRRLPGAKAVNSRKVGGRGWSVSVRTFLRREHEP